MTTVGGPFTIDDDRRWMRGRRQRADIARTKYDRSTDGVMGVHGRSLLYGHEGGHFAHGGAIHLTIFLHILSSVHGGLAPIPPLVPDKLGPLDIQIGAYTYDDASYVLDYTYATLSFHHGRSVGLLDPRSISLLSTC